MKKIYKNPEMVIVKIQPQQMLAMSLVIEGETDTVDARESDFDWEDE